MTEILEAAPRSGEDRPVFQTLDFRAARFVGEAQFGNCIFEGGANFGSCKFEDGANFGSCEFRGGAEFGAAHFAKACNFTGANITGRAFFKAALIEGTGWFDEILCKDVAGFYIDSAHKLHFRRAKFENSALFRGSCSGIVDFEGATFNGQTEFAYTATDRIFLKDATFDAPGDFGVLRAMNGINLQGLRANEAFEIKLQSRTIRAVRMRTHGAAHIEFLGDLDLEDADFDASTLITSIPPERWESLGIESPTPDSARITSLRFTDVRQVTIGAVDLSICRMLGAHGLDAMKIEPSATWESLPIAWSSRPRRVIVDEVLCRGQARGAPKWKKLAHAAQAAYDTLVKNFGYQGVDPPYPIPKPNDIASSYRGLRKRKEDDRDAPGAADLYYGEMEMRRHGAGLRSVEGLLLSAYWLISGYALVAWRAIAALVSLIAVSSVVMTCWGFDRSATTPVLDRISLPSGEFVYRGESSTYDLGDGIVYSIRTATSFLRGPEAQPVTAVGHVTEFTLRLLGPVLLGLTFLAIRGRVKR